MSVAILHHFQHVIALLLRQHIQPPVINDEQFRFGELRHRIFV